MLDHIGIRVKDFAKSRRFFLEALAPLGYGVVMEFENATGFGIGGKPDFWIAADPAPTTPLHIAFASPDRKTVAAFYSAALAAGGRDNGAPGIREHYHPNYYGAFVFDPDGNNVEAVCHNPEG